jgi:hypothetical protein
MANRRTGLALALVAIVGAVLALYYWVHKPLTPVEALVFAQTFANLAVALALTVTAGGLGRRLLGQLFGAGSEQSLGGSGWFVEVALGWGALGLGMLALGALHLYDSVAVWLLAVGLLVWLRRYIWGWTMAAVEATRSLVPQGRLERVAAGFTLLMLSLGVLRALAPPVAWDALVYHLTLPVLYARTHGLQVNTADFNLFSGMPQLTEMLYTAASLLRVDVAAGGIAAQVLGCFFGVVLCLGLAASARELDLPGWLAPAILFASLSVVLELASAYAELLLMLFALAVVLALRQWRRQRADRQIANRWLALAGTFAGLACGCKYTGIVVPLAGGAVVLLIALFEAPGDWRNRLMPAFWSAGLFAMVAGAVFAPWLLKNWLLTGSPFYPLLWPAADMDALRQWFYNRPDLAEPWWRALLIFPRATFFGVQGGNENDATLGPLLLLCAGLLVFNWRVLSRLLREELVLLLSFVAVAYVGWVLLVHDSALARQARLFFAFLPALALLGAAGLAGVRALNTPALRLSIVINAAFALVLGLSAIEAAAGFVSQNPLPYLAGAQSATDYATSQLGWYVPALARVNRLPAGSRVIFLWEARSLACDSSIHCVPDVVIDRWWHARRTTGGAAQIVDQWRSEGATDVLVYDTGARLIESTPNNAYDPADWIELAKLRDGLRPLATFGDAYTLYALP